MSSFVPMSRMISLEKEDVNTGSRSETMDCGTPCSLTMSVKNACAKDLAVYGCVLDELAVLAEAVDDGRDHRLVVHAGQRLHEVEANVRPNDGGDREGVQEAGGMKVLRLVLLASCALPHKVLHQAPHVGEVKVAAQSVECAVNALVTVHVDSGNDLRQ
jgi:hypothetical protein